MAQSKQRLSYDVRVVQNVAWRTALFAALQRAHGRSDLGYVGSAGGVHYFQQYGSDQRFAVADADVRVVGA